MGLPQVMSGVRQPCRLGRWAAVGAIAAIGVTWLAWDTSTDDHPSLEGATDDRIDAYVQDRGEELDRARDPVGGRHDERMNPMTTRDIFDRSADLITPKRVFGDPYTSDGVTVIPAASIRGAGGGGEGNVTPNTATAEASRSTPPRLGLSKSQATPCAGRSRSISTGPSRAPSSLS